jgi:hypothetical protein
MITTSRATHALAIATVLCGLAAASAPARGRPPALRGLGTWEAPATRAVQRWEIDVTQREDGVIAGRVVLHGSPLLHHGALHGVLEGRRVSGRITDDAGNHAVSFVGRLHPAGGWRGTYQDRSGEVGRWAWDGLLASPDAAPGAEDPTEGSPSPAPRAR